MSAFVLKPRAAVAYTPEDISVLTAAYETICDAARLRAASDMVRDLVASTVLEIASYGERDPLRIVDRVMAKLGLRVRYAS
jgi:hypothetical protein